MDRKEEVRDNLKKELIRNKEAFLDNSIDKEKALKLLEELNQLTLLITSFEFTEKLFSDPEFMKTLKEEMDKRTDQV